MSKTYFMQLADYNSWANKRLYKVCARLSEKELTRKRDVYFGSIFGTLSHILVADRIWMGRFENTPSGIHSLSEKIVSDFDGLCGQREKEDRRIMDYTKRLDERMIDKPFHYHDMAGHERMVPLAMALGHLFNHQTHHRGHVHGLLSRYMDEPPALDIIYFCYEKGVESL